MNKLDLARLNLSELVNYKVAQLHKQLGFDFTDTNNAPNNYQDLMLAYQFSITNTKPLPVFSGASDNTIYPNRKSNWGFRFWHDLVHCMNGFDFTLKGEILTANKQIQDVVNCFGDNSLEHKIFYLDTIGQATYSSFYKTFPDNQLEFIKSFLR